MKILIIRHGDPDYENDSLTEKGFREAELLKERLKKLDITAFYCSPLGRACATAKPTLEAYGKNAEICDWLREFNGYVLEDDGKNTGAWDRLPSSLYGKEECYDKSRWLDVFPYNSGTVKEKYINVCNGLDEILKRHGYVHDKNVYRVERENTDTIAFFCHYGVECVLLSHLLHTSPVIFWQGFVALTSSVTTLNTEEREQGIASLRLSGFGDISHLYAANEPASFQARFCEVYSDASQRH